LDAAVFWEEYLGHSEHGSADDFLMVGQGSEFRYLMRIGAVELSAYDQFSSDITLGEDRAVDPTTGAVLDEKLEHGELVNVAGAEAFWALNPYVRTTVGYSRTDVMPQDRPFDHLDRTAHGINAAIDWDLRSDLKLTVDGSWADNDYSETFLNDGDAYLVGASLTMDYNKVYLLTLAAHWNYMDFQSHGRVRDSSDVDDVDYSSLLTHKLSKHWSHTLGYSRAHVLGDISNSREEMDLSYDVQWSGLLEGYLVSAGFNWIQSEDSGGISPEDYDLYTADLGVNFNLSQRSSCRVGYVIK